MDNLIVEQVAREDPHVLLVCLLGVGVVFIGLVLMVGIVMLMNAVCDALAKKSKASPVSPAQTAAQTAVQTAVIENRDEIAIAACVAIAEATGTDASALRVVSLKKVN